MRRSISCALAVAMFTAALAAQGASSPSQSPEQKAAEKKPAAKPPTTVVALTGCVGGGRSAGEPFTITSDDGTIAYKLSGKNMRQYLGHRVTIVGSNDTRRLKVVGGLYPSPNVAAQAGALSATKAAVAADPISTAAKTDQQLPEFRVKSVQSSGASCG